MNDIISDLGFAPNAVFDAVQKMLHQQVRSKGFWDHETVGIGGIHNPSIPFEKLMLIVSELAEAAEELRKPRWRDMTYYGTNGKPEGIAPELADAMIRLFDLAEWLEISLIDSIIEKDAYNRTREHLHGKLA